MRMRSHFLALLLLWGALCPCQVRGAINLLERYPATVAAEVREPRQWTFGANDIFRLSEFKLAVGDHLRVEAWAADLVVGHSDAGAVWAVVRPRIPGILTTQITNVQETVAHIWLRFHPGQLHALFPPETVFPDGAKDFALEAGVIARAKMRSSWQSNGRAMIPPPEAMTVDVETLTGIRRFFSVDKAAGSARYVSAFESQVVKRPPPVTQALAEATFGQVWSAFDRDYAMFTLRPEVNWPALREELRPRAIVSKSTYELAQVIADMLKPLRDLHVWLTVNGANIPVFDRPREANANPAALPSLLPTMQTASREIQWTISPEKTGYILVRGWTDPETPGHFDKTLEELSLIHI